MAGYISRGLYLSGGVWLVCAEIALTAFLRLPGRFRRFAPDTRLGASLDKRVETANPSICATVPRCLESLLAHPPSQEAVEEAVREEQP